MCVIAVIPREKTIQKDDLKKCWNRNPDGAGYMFAHEGKIIIRKFMKWEEFISHFKRDHAVMGGLTDFILHFRIATSGGVNMENAHPFKAGPDHAFVHNGVLGQGSLDGKKSDTHLFRDLMAAPLLTRYPDLLQSEVLAELIRGYIGSYNKMVFLRKDGLYRIINESAGSWKDGLWFSNTHWSYEYKAPAKTDYYGSYWQWNKPEGEKGKGEKKNSKGENNCRVKERVREYDKCAHCPTLTSAPDGLCFRCHKEVMALKDPFYASDKLPLEGEAG